jgi:hypothetical protein
MLAAIASRYCPAAGSRWWPNVLTPGKPELDPVNDNREMGERSPMTTSPEGCPSRELLLLRWAPPGRGVARPGMRLDKWVRFCDNRVLGRERLLAGQ